MHLFNNLYKCIYLLNSKYTLHTIVSSNQFNLPININIGSNSLTDDLQPWRCFKVIFLSSSDLHVTGCHWWSLEGAVTHHIIPVDRLCRPVLQSERRFQATSQTSWSLQILELEIIPVIWYRQYFSGCGLHTNCPCLYASNLTRFYKETMHFVQKYCRRTWHITFVCVLICGF